MGGARAQRQVQKNHDGSTLSVEGITSERSAFGPIGRGNRRSEEDAFIQRFGYPPTYIKIGYDSNLNNKLFTGIWVNVTNPIQQITLDQAASIFTTGGYKGDITHQSQLGIEGDFGPRIKFVPMVIDDKGTLSDGTLAGPLHRMASAIGININKAPGKPLDPWLKAYCEFLLPKDTQDIIGSPEMRKVGFRPLLPGEAAEELKKRQ